MSTPKELAQKNLDIFLEHGSGLRADYSVWIEAKDTVNHRVLLGGLGGMGCGQMWVDEEPRHKNYTGYEEAPEVDSHKCPIGLF